MNVAHQELTKLHFVNSLFADLIGHDLYLAQQVKAAIESALEDEADPQQQEESFNQAAVLLLQNHFRRHPTHGFAHWSCGVEGGRFDPLWARQELIALFKKLAPYSSATVVITNLRAGICPPGKRWTRSLHQEYRETVAFIQELACNWSTRHAKVTLLFF